MGSNRLPIFYSVLFFVLWHCSIMFLYFQYVLNILFSDCESFRLWILFSFSCYGTFITLFNYLDSNTVRCWISSCCIFLHSYHFHVLCHKENWHVCRPCEGYAQSWNSEHESYWYQETCHWFWWRLCGFRSCRWGHICCCQETGHTNKHSGRLSVAPELCQDDI